MGREQRWPGERVPSIASKFTVFSLLLFANGFFYFQKSPFTEDTHSGATGAHVASDAVEELNNALVPVQIPDHKTEEETAAAWDPKQNQEFVTLVDAQVNCTLVTLNSLKQRTPNLIGDLSSNSSGNKQM